MDPNRRKFMTNVINLFVIFHLISPYVILCMLAIERVQKCFL